MWCLSKEGQIQGHLFEMFLQHLCPGNQKGSVAIPRGGEERGWKPQTRSRDDDANTKLSVSNQNCNNKEQKTYHMRYEASAFWQDQNMHI
jgi:hypothetical protein